jgi:hypothetical protein
MIMLMEKEKEKAPSMRLKEKIHACIASFQKLGTAVNEALEQGRKEGFTDKEIGKIIREEMLQAGFERSTVASYLPFSAKQRPRGKPGSRNKISGKNPQTNAVDDPKLEEEQLQDEVLAIDDREEQNKQMHKNKISPTTEAPAVDVRRVGSLVGNTEVQAAAAIEQGTEADEYDIENLENYSKSTLIRIIKLQHKRLQEGSNEGKSWKSKYMRLKAEYRRATGKYWID